MQDTMVDRLLNVDCKVTGIGSVPHKDVDYICELILSKFPDIPYCPQFSKIDARENMFLQCSENLPCLKADLEKEHIYYDNSVNKEEKLLEFYDHLTRNSYEYFKITSDYAKGFYTLLEKSKNKQNQFIKGQVIGPITFLSSILGENGRALIHDDVMSDVIVKGLAMKGIWQAKEIKKTGKIPVIFYDEPYLASFGSAYLPIEGKKVIAILNDLIDFINEREDILIGLHCCGNTDWEMLLETRINIISFDSYGFSEYFVLYPNAIKKFLARNGVIVWGAVPTAEYRDGISLDELCQKLNKALNILERKGIDKELLLKNSLFSPSCGMGLLNEKTSEKIMNLTAALAERMKK